MSDKVNSFLVTLSEDVSEEDSETLRQLLGVIRGVIDVSPNVTDFADHIATCRVTNDLRKRLWDALEKDGIQ